MRGPSNTLATWTGNLEMCFGGPSGKATPEWQATNTDPKPLAQMQADHPDFMATCALIRTWITGSVNTQTLR
jgi:hypothetical protein